MFCIFITHKRKRISFAYMLTNTYYIPPPLEKPMYTFLPPLRRHLAPPPPERQGRDRQTSERCAAPLKGPVYAIYNKVLLGLLIHLFSLL